MTLENTFDSHEQLTNIQVDITGAETATLTEADYSETDNGDGTYTYSATYSESASGEYTFTLTTAENANGASATWGGQSTTISTATSIIDSFEDQDFAEYTDNGDGTNLTTGTTFVTDGSYGMEYSRNKPTNGICSLSGDGLNYYPKPGDTWQIDMQFSASDVLLYHGFLMQGYATDNTNGQGFTLTVEPTNSQIRLWKDWTNTQLASGSATINTGTQYTAEVSINSSDGTITGRLLDSSGSQLTSASATDADAASGGAYDANYGVAWGHNDTSGDNSVTYLDHVRTV